MSNNGLQKEQALVSEMNLVINPVSKIFNLKYNDNKHFNFERNSFNF